MRPIEMRLIPDVRLPINFRDKDDYAVCANPALQDIPDRAEFLDRVFHGAPHRVNERDVNDAFARVATHTDCVSILRTEFAGGELGLLHDIVFCS